MLLSIVLPAIMYHWNYYFENPTTAITQNTLPELKCYGGDCPIMHSTAQYWPALGKRCVQKRGRWCSVGCGHFVREACVSSHIGAPLHWHGREECDKFPRSLAGSQTMGRMAWGQRGQTSVLITLLKDNRLLGCHLWGGGKQSQPPPPRLKGLCPSWWQTQI